MRIVYTIIFISLIGCAVKPAKIKSLGLEVDDEDFVSLENAQYAELFFYEREINKTLSFKDSKVKVKQDGKIKTSSSNLISKRTIVKNSLAELNELLYTSNCSTKETECPNFRIAVVYYDASNKPLAWFDFYCPGVIQSGAIPDIFLCATKFDSLNKFPESDK